jgi:hypothetical protein
VSRRDVEALEKRLIYLRIQAQTRVRAINMVLTLDSSFFRTDVSAAHVSGSVITLRCCKRILSTSATVMPA